MPPLKKKKAECKDLLNTRQLTDLQLNMPVLKKIIEKKIENN